jgi:hypothetical protein
MKQFSGFFLDKSQRAFMPEPSSISEKPTCSLVLAYFIVSVASFLTINQIRVVDEVIIVVNMFRKLLLCKAAKDSPEDRLAVFAGSGIPVDFVSGNGQSISVFPTLLDHLFEDMLPSLVGNQVR